ncbi:MAG: hypothetical protein A3K77_06365 [Euryarchaeota archaeon RBG_13_31_8]|nr:MAG: hypothetical protein A3K77_06365 [Euryarchaeota archaeon RBG_13_31_8]
MSHYKDFEYVKYILNLPYIEGLEIYNKCIGRFNDKTLFELFKCEIIRGTFEGSFDDYKKLQTSSVQVSQMTYKEKEKEEKRIIEKIIDIEQRRIKQDDRK